METIKYLMICKEAYLQCIICKTFMQGVVHTGEVDVVSPILEDTADAVYLLLAVTADEKSVTTGQILTEALSQQVEVLMEQRLQGNVECQGGIRGTCGFGTKLQATEIQHTHLELIAIHELTIKIDVFCLFSFTGCHSLRQQGLIVYLVNALAKPEEVFHTYEGICWERL